MSKFNINIDGKEIEFEIRDLAEQANGSCLVRSGDTLILATSVMATQEQDVDFLPLTVEYGERYYAAGKIRGPRYIKREGRPSDEAIITARLIDRALRPRFPQNLRREIQVIITCLSWDGENDPDILGLLGASLALSLSDIPWTGPIGVVRVSPRENDENSDFVLNPSYEQREKSKLDIMFAGVKRDDQVLINMIEGQAEEVSEGLLLEASKRAEPELKKLIDFQEEVARQIGKEKITLPETALDPKFEKEIRKFLGDRLEEALYFAPKPIFGGETNQKKERSQEKDKLREELLNFIKEEYSAPEKIKEGQTFFEKEIERVIHQQILEKEKRPDGRKLDEIREISAEAGILPRTHGSGLFCRGTTKALSILTLGAPGDQQLLEGMEIVGKKRFMHHYNFPPYSVGEVKPIRGPGRREIGHGILTEKALLPLIPGFDDFPYTIRIVSEILSSNGSTSMASVSSSSLALMDAGVPIRQPAAGIAIGLMADESKNYKLLADIQGPEDAHGDMDLKVAGTKRGITALQMDVKIAGINRKIFEEALNLAKKCRLKILAEIEKVLPKPRAQLSPYAPRILILQIDPKKIRDVIGPGGKVINEIIDECGVAIDIEDDGKIFITSESEEAAKKALAWIKNITREIRTGEVFQGKVKRILDFGAFLEILPNQEGLLHVSELGPLAKKGRGRAPFIKKASDVVKVGQLIKVQVISIDEQGRINLSLEKNH